MLYSYAAHLYADARHSARDDHHPGDHRRAGHARGGGGLRRTVAVGFFNPEACADVVIGAPGEAGAPGPSPSCTDRPGG